MRRRSQALRIQHWKRKRGGARVERRGAGRGGPGTSWNVASWRCRATLREVGEAGEGGTNIYGALAVCLVPSSRVWAPAGLGWGELQAGVSSEQTEGGKVAGRPGSHRPQRPRALPGAPVRSASAWFWVLASGCLAVDSHLSGVTGSAVTCGSRGCYDDGMLEH